MRTEEVRELYSLPIRCGDSINVSEVISRLNDALKSIEKEAKEIEQGQLYIDHHPVIYLMVLKLAHMNGSQGLKESNSSADRAYKAYRFCSYVVASIDKGNQINLVRATRDNISQDWCEYAINYEGFQSHRLN